ncbi:hypothetical protein [Tautonia sociabilis]|uniref:hypothetical protein n=1 Tax=Tautonia sociabilis TaxID=2080755 RepID=UPI001315A64C|nr:hypothetical protein [Tautonia sociabilis]
MSGPIVRKYGFPNFDKIFGPKPVLHGVEEESQGGRPEEGREPAREGAKPAGDRAAEGEGSGVGEGPGR